MPETIPSPAPIVLRRSEALDDEGWKVLLRRIHTQKCTPFLGPETCFDFSIPSASMLALEWADEHHYPFDDRNNLPRVAQFVAYKAHQGIIDEVKMDLAEKFRGLKVPDFSHVDEPYRILASLPLSVYVNTHYFAFMSYALRSAHKEPQQVVCRWNESDPGLPADCDPRPACPLVFHMFGHVADPPSLVLTEDDYLDFLVRTSDKLDLIPQSVQSAMRNNSLLFLGYQTNDLDFRVILRCLARLRKDPRKSSNYTIQFIHVSDDKLTSEQMERLKSYFKDYNQSMSISLYWGTTGEFMAELRQRWEVYSVNSQVG
jgi:hypothetical protein